MKSVSTERVYMMRIGCWKQIAYLVILIQMIQSIREMQESDIQLIAEYFSNAKPNFLKKMGIDPKKVLPKEKRKNSLKKEFHRNIEKRKSFCLIWLLDNEPIGHTIINKILFGKEAYMHLHIWYPENRQQGFGEQFLKDSIPYFFDYYKLKNLYCQPYSLNPAPNKTLIKLGFKFNKSYETVPAPVCFKQIVNQYVLTESDFKKHYSTLPT